MCNSHTFSKGLFAIFLLLSRHTINNPPLASPPSRSLEKSVAMPSTLRFPDAVLVRIVECFRLGFVVIASQREMMPLPTLCSGPSVPLARFALRDTITSNARFVDPNCHHCTTKTVPDIGICHESEQGHTASRADDARAARLIFEVAFGISVSNAV